MEQKLRVIRMVAAATFIVSLVIFGWAVFTSARTFFVSFSFLANLSLCIFFGTESFGPIAARRGTAGRVLARVFFVPCLLGVFGAGYNLVAVAMS
jgi:hypothetical protein